MNVGIHNNEMDEPTDCCTVLYICFWMYAGINIKKLNG